MTFERELCLVVVQCCACSVEYAIPQSMYDSLKEKRDSGRTMCPNGHGWHYTGASSEQKIREAEQRAEEAERRLHELEAARADPVGAAQGKVVPCPVCGRYFTAHGVGIHRTKIHRSEHLKAL